MFDGLAARSCAAFALVLLIAAPGGPASAGDDTRLKLSLSSLSDAEIDARLQFLEQRLDSERTGAQLWQYGWTAFNGGSMAAEAAFAATADNRKDRATDAVQSVEGLIGVLNLVLRPLPARFGADPLRDLPGATRADRLNRLSLAEDLLRRGAARADEPYEILPHVGVVAVNLLAGAAIWKLADLRHAYQAVIPGIVLGELQLWTIPQRPVDDLDGYRARTTASSRAPTWQVVALPGGVEISLRF